LAYQCLRDSVFVLVCGGFFYATTYYLLSRSSSEFTLMWPGHQLNPAGDAKGFLGALREKSLMQR